MTSPAFETALYYARRGFYVFPVKPKSKFPLKNFKWKEWSTKDEKVLAQFNLQYPDSNWAVDCGKSGIFLIDKDRKNGFDGVRHFQELYGLPTTNFRVQTPKTGEHDYYIGYGRNSTDKDKDSLGKNIDTRGVGGYALIPGSIDKNGTPYKFLESGNLGNIPAYVPAHLRKKIREKTPTNGGAPGIEFDLPHNVQQGLDFMATKAPEVSQGSRDNTAYRVACSLLDYGLSASTILGMMIDWNAEKVSPPLQHWEIERKVQSAFESRVSPIGIKTPEKMFPELAMAQADPQKDFFHNAKDEIAMALDERKWLLEYRYSPGFITTTIAPGGVGKSSLVILEALSVATGQEQTFNKVIERGNVWLHNTEDPTSEISRRIAAATILHETDKEKMNSFWHTSGYDQPLKFAKLVGREVIVNQPLVDWCIAQIIEKDIKLFIIDPFMLCHEVDENSNNQISVVVQIFKTIAEKTGCAISLVHHTRKKAAGFGRGDQDTARGASALVDMSRIVHTLNFMCEKECKEYGIAADRARWYIRLDDGKANLAPPMPFVQWFEKHSVKTNPAHKQTVQALKKIILEKSVEVDEDKQIVDSLPEVMLNEGQNYSFYELANAISTIGFCNLTAKQVARKLENIFNKDSTIIKDRVYSLIPGKGRTGKPTNFLQFKRTSA